MYVHRQTNRPYYNMFASPLQGARIISRHMINQYTFYKGIYFVLLRLVSWFKFSLSVGANLLCVAKQCICCQLEVQLGAVDNTLEI